MNENGTAYPCFRIIDQKFDSDTFFFNGDPTPFDFFNQRNAHVAGSVRTATCRTPFRVMVRLVTDILSQRIVRERDTQCYKVMESQRRHSGFHQCNIAMHGTARRKVARHEYGAVPFFARHAQLVISLLITAGIDGGPHAESLGINGNIFHALRIQTYCGSKAGSTAADDQCIELFHRIRIFRSQVRHPH